MTIKIKSRLYRLKERLYKFVGRGPLKKETLEHDTVLKPPYKPTWEERRKEAMEYWVKEYYESKMREEKLRKKLESYGKVRRWAYKRIRNLKVDGMIVKETVVKPLGMTIAAMSGFFSLILAASTAPKIVKFIHSVVPFPYNVVIDVIVTFPIGFSPGIIAEGLYVYYVKKEIKKRLKKDYRIEA